MVGEGRKYCSENSDWIGVKESENKNRWENQIWKC